MSNTLVVESACRPCSAFSNPFATLPINFFVVSGSNCVNTPPAAIALLTILVKGSRVSCPTAILATSSFVLTRLFIPSNIPLLCSSCNKSSVSTKESLFCATSVIRFSKDCSFFCSSVSSILLIFRIGWAITHSSCHIHQVVHVHLHVQ